MLNTIAAITDRVFQQLEGGWMSDDTRLSYRLVRDKVLAVRADMIKEMMGIGSLPDSLYQRCCIELSCQELCGSGVYRKVGAIPSMADIGGKEIRFLGTVEGKSFERRKTAGRRYELHQPFATVNPSYRITGTEVEVTDIPLGLETVVAEVILIDPALCPPCKKDDELVLPFPALLIDKLEVRALKELEQIWLMPRDKRNDASPSK